MFAQFVQNTPGTICMRGMNNFAGQHASTARPLRPFHGQTRVMNSFDEFARIQSSAYQRVAPALLGRRN